MRYLSVCAGIEAATVAWHPLGWTPAAFSEIEAFPRAVLAHHYPTVPLHGDFTTIGADEYGAIDLLAGGTPCQDYSLAGLRAGIAGEQGNLTLEFVRLASRKKPRWLLWENVPGVLSVDGGRALGALLGGLAELGYGFAYRVLDAQYFNVAQRRERVFVVGYLGDWRRAAAVLFEPESLQGNPPPRRQSKADVAAGALRSTDGGCDVDNARARHLVAFGGNNTSGPIDVATAVNAHGVRQDFETETFIAHAFDARQSDVIQYGDRTGPLDTDGYSTAVAAAVRRLTPREWERLQGFPDDYTLVPYRKKPAADGPRYHALGNSMAVPVMRWIGERIAMVEAIAAERAAA